MMYFYRSDLEKILAQDYGCTYEQARRAVARYFGELDQDDVDTHDVRLKYYWQRPWFQPYKGDIHRQLSIAEWIWGNDHYWKKGRRPKR